MVNVVSTPARKASGVAPDAVRILATCALCAAQACAPTAPPSPPAAPPAPDPGPTSAQSAIAAPSDRLCGFKLENARQARVDTVTQPPIIHIEGNIASFALDNRESEQPRSCTFDVAGPGVRLDSVFFGFENVGAPKGSAKPLGNNRVRIEYPIPERSMGLISVEPPVAIATNPYAWKRGGLSFRATGAALLRQESGVWITRALSPKAAIEITNQEGQADVEIVIENTSQRLSTPAVRGLGASSLVREGPLRIRVKGRLPPNQTARLELKPKPLAFPFSFGFGGDVRGAPDVFDRLVKRLISEGDPLFLVTTGDHTLNSLLYEIEEFQKVAEAIPIPIYAVKGNHEVHCQGNAHYARMYGPSRYHFQVADMLFVILSSNHLEKGELGLGEEQLAWLDEVLTKQKRVRRKLLALHAPPHPLHSPSSWPFYPANLAAADAAKLKEIARRHKVDYVLSGHVHMYARGVEHGTVYLTSGGGGAHYSKHESIPGFVTDTAKHLMLMRVKRNGFDEKLMKLPDETAQAGAR